LATSQIVAFSTRSVHAIQTGWQKAGALKPRLADFLPQIAVSSRNNLSTPVATLSTLSTQNPLQHSHF